eukprot:522466_1
MYGKKYLMLTKNGKTEYQKKIFFLVELNRYLISKYSWNNWNCGTCGNTDSNYLSKLQVPPSQHVQKQTPFSKGWPLRVYRTKCFKCNETTDWIRYSDPRRMFFNQTYGGVCAEHAAHLAIIVNAFDYKWRVVWCVTDHVWLEVYSESLGWWVRIGGDPNNNGANWYGSNTIHNRRRSPYIIGVGLNKDTGKMEILDLSLMYTNNFDVKVLAQRRKDWHVDPAWMFEAAKEECRLAEVSFQSVEDLHQLVLNNSQKIRR